MAKIINEKFLTQEIKNCKKIKEQIKLNKKIPIEYKFKYSVSKKISLFWQITQTVAAKITGILKRFEKKTTKFLLYPKKRRKIIMEPDLLTPGINAKH